MCWVIWQVIRPLLGIVSALHSLGIVHRDIKPENIFINIAGKQARGRSMQPQYLAQVNTGQYSLQVASSWVTLALRHASIVIA